jgi:tetratricopeptide (TPR) repeat protein
MAHRALRARLAAAGDAAGLLPVVREVESFFPAAAADRVSAGANLAPWLTPYANDPAAAYRTAPPSIRKALDRRLWADARERLLELEASHDLPSAVARSEQAAAELPEKPELSARLLDQALARSRQNLGGLRLAEVKELAAVYRDKRRQPDEALKVLREWLDLRRGRLSDTDAEGPVALANLYDELLQDRVTAIALLRKAWKIDPGSQEISEAFRTRGYRKAQDDWVEATPEARANAAADRPPAAPLITQSLRGLAPEEVRRKMGAPTRISYSASKGQLVQQWIYLDNPKLVRYVNFLHAPGELKPRLISYYTLPRASVKGGPGTAR